MQARHTEERLIMTQTQETAPTVYRQAGETRFAYRDLGHDSGVPLIFLNRFRGTMDDWDPDIINRLARSRRVILFDNAGVGLSTGTTPDSVSSMAADAASFISALADTPVDVLGFSLGGYVAQRLTLDYPGLVRKLILAGTGAGGGEQPDDDIRVHTSAPVITREDLDFLFFAPTAAGKAAGAAHWERIHSRVPAREPELTAAALAAHIAAVGRWRTGEGSPLKQLHEIQQPVLVANGDKDRMVPTSNSVAMQEEIPNAQLIIYPNAGHGFLFQYADLFAEHVARFLDTSWDPFAA